MVYRIIRIVVKIWLSLRFRIKVEGLNLIPNDGCILAMNHRSYYDSLLVGVHTPRKMFIMAKEELFNNKIVSWVIRQMGAFPVKRNSADIKSLKHSLKLIDEGNIFSIFIEGTRSKSEEMLDPKKGIGFLVAKSKSPVVPVLIQGVTGGWFSKVTVRFGAPIDFNGEEYDEIAKKVANAIKSLAIKNQLGTTRSMGP
ncbi:lysophospholipid acyltransferase family protein [Effusibacillus consociatus]|uniref:Lysophospholipid acyltransferase family protein n=1 Tax=Effusibacillus consociatus TaxID=1117041 RepID=A0ABV9Q1X6_9BACL